MGNLLLVGVIILLLIILLVLLNILKNNSLKRDREFSKLNEKIDYLTNLVKENTKKSSSEKTLHIPESNAYTPEPKEKKESLSFEKKIISEKRNQENIHSPVSNPVKLSNSKKERAAIDFEKLLGENILSKIGITTLVLGIAYFVKYAIDQNWIGELGRVGIGVITGFLIIGIAHKLREKYLSFSALLAGGGISVLYITITIAFREYELFSQPVALIILTIITVFSVMLSLYYNQRILAIFSILGGFASPLLVSSGTGNYITLFSYILVLNTGMLVLAYKKKWTIVNLLSYFFTYIFYAIWLFLSSEIKSKTGAISFSFLFFIQFYILVLIEYFKVRKISPYQVFVILSNNFLFYIFLFYIFRNSPGNIKGIITFCMGLINIFPIFLLLKIKEKNTLFLRLLIGIVISFFSLSIPIQLKGSAITMFWGVEAILLLWLFIRTRIGVFKFSFLVLEILALISLFIDYLQYYIYNISDLAPIINPVFITGSLIMSCLYIVVLMLKKQENSYIKVFQIELINLNSLRRIFCNILILLLFIFPFTELTYQLGIRNYLFFEILLIQGVYLYLFIAVGILIRKYNFGKSIYSVFLVLAILYSVLYLNYVVSSSIRERFYIEEFSYKVFMFHFLTVPAFIIMIIFLCKKNIFKNPDIIYWITSVISVIALSVEIDNVVLMVYEESVLENIHTIVYPVAWGIAALILIVAGMKYKKIILRKISLALFMLIILKLYLYDVWKMPQSGRIISFVILGLILLGTSFLYQKLKVLIKDESRKTKD